MQKIRSVDAEIKLIDARHVACWSVRIQRVSYVAFVSYGSLPYVFVGRLMSGPLSGNRIF